MSDRAVLICVAWLGGFVGLALSVWAQGVEEAIAGAACCSLGWVVALVLARPLPRE